MWKRSLLLVFFATVIAAGSPDLAQVETLIATGKYAQALEALQAAAPSNARWHLLASKAFDGLKQPERAASEARTALELDPENEAHHLQLGQIFIAWNNPVAAPRSSAKAWTVSPKAFYSSLATGWR